MTDKKELEMEAKAAEEEIIETEVKLSSDAKENEPIQGEQNASEETHSQEEQLTSLDLLWRHAFGELDEWVKRADFRDDLLLKEANLFAESIQRNQANLIEVAAQFYQEFSAWEKTARDEFLMSTTSLQHFFPLKSYEDINTQIDQIQEQTLAILAAPYQKLASNLSVDKYLEMIDQYIAIRKKVRQQYVKTVKQAGNLVYENQKGFVNLFAKQIKALMFPLNKYLEKAEELTKL